MLKIIIFFIAALSISYGFVWLSNNSGYLELEWLGYQIETTASFAIIALILVLAIIWLLFQLLASFFGIPSLFKKIFRKRRLNHNLKNIETSLAAIFSGDLSSAEKNFSKIEVYGENADSLDKIKKILAAKISEDKGNLLEAEKNYNALIDSHETKYFATKGLLNTAFIEGNINKSIKLAEQAYKIKPNVKNGAHSLLELYKKAERWEDAENFLKSYKRRFTFSSDENNNIDTDKEFALIWYNISKSIFTKPEPTPAELELAYNYSEKAVKELNDNASILKHHIELALANNKYDKLYKIIEKFWSKNDDSEVIEYYFENMPTKTKSEKLKKQRKIKDKLTKIRPFPKGIDIEEKEVSENNVS